jgi:REP-associated tyrosine transposase
MARMPREEVEGGIFHVFARGNRRQQIYLDDVDRRRYLAMLGSVVKQYDWRCLAYCLMENHVHLLLETPRANLGGHLFQGRYGSVRVTTDAQLWMLARYLALNPVEAELCERPGEWPWSSHGAVIGSRLPRWLDHPRLLEYFAAAGGDPPGRYRAMVAGD